ncbi:hypothetical protein [Streptomyces sp. NPDC093111]|uniref:hypothetical protein n=1 Tax=Streptomyces sp. NPDC093111 TaxID=3154978 RepID=UPI00343BDC9C
MKTIGRRALLTAGAAGTAAALAGCTSPGDTRPAPPSAAERAARAEAALRTRSAATGRTLLGRYDAVLSAHPSLAGRLAPLRASVAAHVKALGEGGTPPAPAPKPTPPATPTGSGTPHSPAAPGPRSPAAPSPRSPAAPAPVPADPAVALTELAAAERATADTHTATLLTAPPEYARLLASVAAAGAAHAYLLTEGGRG